MGVVAVVVSPFEFFKVTVHMLDAHLVEGSDKGLLEQGPHALDAVGVNVSDHPFFLGMVNRFMAGVMILDTDIGLQLVRIDRLGLVLHCALDEVMKGLAPNVRNALNAELPAALDGSSDPLLVPLISVPLALLLAADQGFIHLDNAHQRRTFKGVISHRLTNAVAKVPSRPVGGSEGFLQLVCRYPFLRYAHEVDRHEPFAEGKAGIVHDGSTRHGKLISATVALVLIALRNFADAHIAAPSTGNAIGPANFLNGIAAFVIAFVLV